MKIQPLIADRGDHLVLKGSCCKGGRPRAIPIRTESQREALDYAKAVTKNHTRSRSLIPYERSYREHLTHWRRETERAGVSKTHAFRHNYAVVRYAEITGRKAPVEGGPAIASLNEEEQRQDRRWRLELANELGHARHQIVAIYVGS